MDTSAIEKLLKEFIGLNVSSIGTNTLESAISKRITFLGLPNERSYREYLQNSKSEVNELIEEVTVNETWFFRDSNPFTAMASFAETWREKHPGAKLHILSLPCSTGEEPYSIAITMLEAGWHEFAFHIDAIDINTKVLTKAEEAVYNQNSFRGRDRYFSEKYFRKSGKNFVLKNKFKQTVQFQKGNLVGYKPTGAVSHYDVIFCRNLLIYLDKNAQDNAIQTLDNLLAPGGLLFIGHAEAGAYADSQFTASSYPKSFSLVRRGDGQKISSESEIQAGIDGQYPLFEQSSNGPFPSKKRLDHKPLFVGNEILEARYLLDKKEYEQAIKVCNKFIDKHGPSSQAYFWLGAILLEEMKNREALQMLRRAIYLDPENIDAMELLATIFLKIEDQENYQLTNKRITRVRNRLSRRGPL